MYGIVDRSMNSIIEGSPIYIHTYRGASRKLSIELWTFYTLRLSNLYSQSLPEHNAQ